MVDSPESNPGTRSRQRFNPCGTLTPSAGTAPDLLAASTNLFAITLVTNLCNYFFHALASRRLGPGDYGAFVSMLALLSAVAIPSQALQMVIGKYVARYQHTQEAKKISSLLKYSLLHALLAGAVLAVGLSLASKLLAHLLQLSSGAPVVAVGMAAFLWLLLPVVRGALQGLQNFTHLGLNMLFDGLFRLLIGALFFALGFRVAGAIYAGALAGGMACLLALWPLGRLWSLPLQPSSNIPFKTLYFSGLPVLLTLGGFMLLSSLDILLVKRFFLPEAAGYYSAGSLVGKAFLFLPFAVSQVLFPKVSAIQNRTEGAYHLLRRALLLTATILIGGILTVWVGAPFIVRTLFGEAFLNSMTLHLVRVFGLALAPLALVYVLLQYNLALDAHRLGLILFLDIPLLCLTILLYHPGLNEVLFCVGLNHLCLLIAAYSITRYSLSQQNRTR